MSDSEDDLIYAGGGEIDTGEFSLVITSDTLEPAEITGLLGIQPTDSHRRGDLNQAGKPFPFGRWRLATPRIDFRTGPVFFQNSFDAFVRMLPDARDAWSRIAGEYQAQVFVHLWMKTWNREFEVSFFALSELVRRRLSLHVDIYAEDES